MEEEVRPYVITKMEGWCVTKPSFKKMLTAVMENRNMPDLDDKWLAEAQKFCSMDGFIEFDVVLKDTGHGYGVRLWAVVAVFDTVDNAVIAKMIS